MRILVLGGTQFLGRHFVEMALARGFRPTLFHRGETGRDLFPALEHVLGNRDGGLGALADREWDAVVDTSGYLPRVVGDAARRLASAAGHYLFVSTISVYASLDRPGLDESTPVGVLSDPSVEEITGGTYGPLKARCEEEVRAAFGDRATVVRPGLIVGPDDPTNRFGYWPRRMHRGGEVLVPAPPDAPVQFIDVRDLAGWMLALLERGPGGTYHATGPAAPLGFGAMVAACRVPGRDARLVWVDEDFLLEREVSPWTGLPLWLPAADRAHSQLDVSRAIAAGLRFRPLAETARDTLEWELANPVGSRPPRRSLGGGGPLEPGRELELLAEWGLRKR